MTTYYTNNPSRFGTCFATHNPLVSQVVSGGGGQITIPTVTSVGGGGKNYKFTPFSPGRLQAELARREALKQTAIGEAFAKAVEAAVTVPDKPEVVFEPSTTTEAITPELNRRVEAYEAVADEIAEKTKKRLEKLALEREEEELLVMLLAQEI